MVKNCFYENGLIREWFDENFCFLFLVRLFPSKLKKKSYHRIKQGL